jgi:hypothetical protein
MTYWSLYDFGDEPKPLPAAPVPAPVQAVAPDEPPRRKGGWPKGRPRKPAE